MSDANGASASIQALYAALEQIDGKLNKATIEQKNKLHEERADVLEKLISASDADEELSSWVRQFADTSVQRLSRESTPMACPVCGDSRTRCRVLQAQGP